MPQSNVVSLFFLHAGTSPALSQLTLTVMFVALGIVLLGIGFGRISKTKESLLQHRWTLTSAMVLTLAAAFLVMIPTTFRFYIDPDVEFFGSLSITTLLHGVLGVLASVTAVIYAFGDLPKNVKKWMRLTAFLWIAALTVGIVMFLQMFSII